MMRATIPVTTTAPHLILSERELETMKLHGAGLRVSQIAKHMSLSKKTVAVYLERACQKLGVSSNYKLRCVAAILYAQLEQTG